MENINKKSELLGALKWFYYSKFKFNKPGKKIIVIGNYNKINLDKYIDVTLESLQHDIEKNTGLNLYIGDRVERIQSNAVYTDMSKTEGKYVPNKNYDLDVIRIRNLCKRNVLRHELLHAISTNSDRTKCGIYEMGSNKNMLLNEGITEYINYTTGNNDDYTYKFYVTIVEALIDIIGQEYIYKAYFENNFELINRKMCDFSSKVKKILPDRNTNEDYIKMLECLNEIYEYQKTDIAVVIENMNTACKCLYKIYLDYLNKELYLEKINMEKYSELLNSFVNKLGETYKKQLNYYKENINKQLQRTA